MENKEVYKDNVYTLKTLHSVICRVIDRVSIKLTSDVFSPLQGEDNRVDIDKNADLAESILVTAIRNKYKI